MTSKIKVLPAELVNQIAAGEVVERPASVIKEMVENAIDAGATQVQVACAQDATSWLRIADNGSGMDEADLQVAFKNHATSKISQKDDLFNLASLGFRGEALASIAAVSQLTCTTKTATMPNGIKAIVAPNGDVTIEDAACAVGTTFEVKQLFYNVPARLKFLKQPKTEIAAIEEMMQGLAISYPAVRFSLVVQDNEILSTTGSGQLGQVLKELFKVNHTNEMIAFDGTEPEYGFRVHGLTSLPNIYRASKKWLFVIVNGRAIKCHILAKAVEAAYDSLITPGKFPVCALFVELPPEQVDVNVHPTKKEVRYAHPNTLYSFIRHTISQQFLNWQPHGLSIAPKTPAEEQSTGFNNPPQWVQDKLNQAPLSYNATDNFQSFRPSSMAQSQQAFDLYTPVNQQSTEQMAMLPERNWRVIGQHANTFILVEQPEGLLVLDQHIISERVLFEQFCDQAERTEKASQPLFVPLQFDVPVALASQLQEHKDAFEALGFELSVEGQQLSVHKAPALYSPRTLKLAFENLLTHLEDTNEVHLNVDDVLATMSCHSAVRAGDVLNSMQMERLVAQWFACTRPWTCPHGRPVSHLIEHKEMMKWFDRPSLPV